MDIFEISGYQTGVSQAGVNFLQPEDAFEEISNGFINRQVLQSRDGISLFAPRLVDNSRIFGIFEHTLPDSTKELLAADANFLYKYNETTGIFDQLPFAGSLVAFAGFNLTSNENYIAGTSYPTKDNAARFVFTGKGMPHIFFYNGTDVRDFTSVADNPDYEAPAGGALTKATHIFWFGERLVLVKPVIAGAPFSQGVLYSAIRSTSGNGDKFNTVGAGLLQLDTFENISGAGFLGNLLILNADRSTWSLSKTTDAFNPFFSEKIPGVLGTNADFSATAWGSAERSLGKTGILETDSRQNLRVDNKIPFFTRDEVYNEKFQLIYGGFDRYNNQFLWTYPSNDNEPITQDMILANNYQEQSWATWNIRATCLGETDLGINLAWDDIEATATHPEWESWDTTEEQWDEIGVERSIQKTLIGDDLGFIYDMHADFSDYESAISAITQAENAVLTVEESAFKAGDQIVISSVEGMTEINNVDDVNPETIQAYEIITATTTSLMLNVDSTSFTAYTTGGLITKLIDFTATTIPFNPYREQGRRVYISHIDLLLNRDNSFVKMDIFADEETDPFMHDVVMKATTTIKDREWVSLSVSQEAEFITFKLKQSNPTAKLKNVAMRIYAEPGALTNG